MTHTVEELIKKIDQTWQALGEEIRTVGIPVTWMDNNTIEYKELPKGSARTTVLHRTSEVFVGNTWMEAGTETEFHQHLAMEVFSVYQGQLFITIQGQEEFCVCPGKSVTIEPNTMHKVRTEEETFLINVSIPCLKMFTHNDDEFNERKL